MCRVSCFAESAEQPLRQRPCFHSYPLVTVNWIPQNLRQSFRFARYLSLPARSCPHHTQENEQRSSRVATERAQHLVRVSLPVLFHVSFLNIECAVVCANDVDSYDGKITERSF